MTSFRKILLWENSPANFPGYETLTKFHLLRDQILLHNMKLMVLIALILPFMGYVADKVGYKKVTATRGYLKEVFNVNNIANHLYHWMNLGV